MTYPSHDYSGLETPNTDPFDEFYNDEFCSQDGAELDDDVDETFYREEEDFDVKDIL